MMVTLLETTSSPVVNVIVPVILLASIVSPSAVLANAFVCGALANPHDRYGARIVWLAPLTVLLLPLTAFRRTPQAHATAALCFTATSAR